MSLLNVHQALEAAALAALTTIPVEHENVEITKPTAAKWSQLFFLPNVPSVETLGDEGEDLADGIYQININYPRNTGDSAARVDFEAVRAAFPAGTKYTNAGQVVTIRNCGRSQGRTVDNWYRVSITVGWEALIPR